MVIDCRTSSWISKTTGFYLHRTLFNVYSISLQAQRDYFGAHTYELLSSPGKFVHTNWTGHGGNVSATTYQV